MKTSSNNIQQTEKYLFGLLTTEESLVFQARALTDPALRAEISLQRKLYSLLRHYHRKKLKERFDRVHTVLLNDTANPVFRNNILHLFQD